MVNVFEKIKWGRSHSEYQCVCVRERESGGRSLKKYD